MKTRIFILAICLSFVLSPITGQNILTVHSEAWGNGDWVNENGLFRNYSYDSNGVLINILTETWNVDTNLWENYQLDEFLNDSNGNVLQHDFYNWKDTTQSWGQYRRETFVYTSSNKLESHFTELFTNGSWYNYALVNYTYDSSDYLILEIVELSNGMGGWRNGSRREFTNDTNGLAQEKLTITWDDDLEEWINFRNDTYLYNSSNKIISNLKKLWTGSIWRNYQKLDYTYGSNDYLINEFGQGWDTSNNNWRNGWQRLYTNNTNGTVFQEVFQQWHSSVNTWLNQWRETYTYGLLGIGENTLFDEISVFPNPTRGIVNINFKDISPVNIQVYDVIGRLVFTESDLLVENFQFNFNEPSGIYFIEIYSENNSRVFKLIKQ